MPQKNATSPVDSTEHLLAFVHNRDVSCPACGYNLRNLNNAVCPEREQPLHLTVGLAQQRVGLLIATVAPCIFSGIAAILLAIPLLMVEVTGGPPQPTSIILTDISGWISGFVGLGIIVGRQRFLRLRPEVQAAWAITMWLAHFAAFGLLVFYVLYYA